MSVVGKPRSYFKKFAFTVEIDRVVFAGFQKAGPLEIELAVVEQYEGGALLPETSPGRAKVTPVVLERGATKDQDLFNWFKEVANLASNTGLVDDQYKRSLDIVQRDRDGTELKRWTLLDAWPSKWGGGDWDNTADQNVMESVTLQYKYPDSRA